MASSRIATGSTIRVRGLDETLRALKQVGDVERRGALKDVFFRAARHIVDGAQARASTTMERAAARGLRASRTQSRAQVQFTERRGFEFGAEFGAAQNQPRRAFRSGTSYTYLGLNQFRPWRGNDEGAGYFLWPAIREETPRVIDAVGEELEKIFEGRR